jgi:hypothetical protein
MRTQPTATSGRRLLALVVGALLLGAASVGVDAATGHAATIGRQATQVHHPARRFGLRDLRAPNRTVPLARGRVDLLCGPRPEGVR